MNVCSSFLLCDCSAIVSVRLICQAARLNVQMRATLV